MSANITRAALAAIRGLRIVEINTLGDAASRELEGRGVSLQSLTSGQIMRLPAGATRDRALAGDLDAKLMCVALLNLRARR